MIGKSLFKIKSYKFRQSADLKVETIQYFLFMLKQKQISILKAESQKSFTKNIINILP